MDCFQVAIHELTGTNYREIRRKSYRFYLEIKSRSRRKPHIRSAYFKKQKIFLDLFWAHLFEKKNHWDQMRRMKYFPCALELIKNSLFVPETKENPNKRSEILHRFAGKSPKGKIFSVQIKEDKSSGKKWLISVFPKE